MPFLKYVMLMDRMDGLIRRKSTGTPVEFANKMSVSRSMLMNYLSGMKDLGAPIEYSKYRGTYFYKEEVDFNPYFKRRNR